MALSKNEWIRSTWENEAEEIIQNVDEIVLFERGSVLWKSERYENWKVVWQMNRVKSFHKKRLQSEVPKMYGDRDHGWLECNTDPRKTASIFSLQEHMIETRAWKKMRGLVEQDSLQVMRKSKGNCSPSCGWVLQISKH